MSDTNYIHQASVTEFLILATSICIYLEEVESPLKSEFIDRMLCDLPLLYTKARQITTTQPQLDGEPEQFVYIGSYRYTLPPNGSADIEDP